MWIHTDEINQKTVLAVDGHSLQMTYEGYFFGGGLIPPCVLCEVTRHPLNSVCVLIAAI